MYDKLGLRTERREIVNLDFLSNNTEDFRPYITQAGNIGYRCTIRNLRFRINDYDVRVEGSPATFLYGQNFETVKYQDLQRFIEELSICLGFNAGLLSVHMLDITDNLEMSHAPITYKRYMGKCRYFKKFDHEYNGLYYRNDQHDLLFYDKLIEAQSKKRQIPTHYLGSNYLRYEYSIKKKVHRKIGTPILRVTDLLDPDVYIETIDTWEKMFNTIDLLDADVHDVNYTNGMDVMDFLLLNGAMHQGGLKKTIEEIDQWHHMGRISYDKAYHKKRKFRNLFELYVDKDLPDGESLKEELRRKIREKAGENRMLV